MMKTNDQALMLNRTLITDFLLKQNSTNFIPNEEILESFSKSLVNYSSYSKTTYLKGAKRFLKYCYDNNIEEVGEEEINCYKNYLYETYEGNTISMYIASLKRLYKFLEKKGIRNYTSDLKGAKGTKYFKKDALTKDQVNMILNYIDTSTIKGKRLMALFRLLLTGALREIEIERANIEDIGTQEGKRVLYIQGKGHDKKDDYIILTNKTYDALQEYLDTRKDKKKSDALFTIICNRNKGSRLKARNIRDIIETLFKEVGIESKRITPHSLRHTGITLSLLGGATLQEAKTFARHQNINTVLIYAHNLEKLKSGTEDKIEAVLES